VTIASRVRYLYKVQRVSYSGDKMGQGSVNVIIWAIVAIIVLAWLIGWLVVPSVGSLIHVLIVIAVIIIIVNILGLFSRSRSGESTTTTTTQS